MHGWLCVCVRACVRVHACERVRVFVCVQGVLVFVRMCAKACVGKDERETEEVGV